MKKRTRKILSLMLAAATAMSLTNFAFAEEETETDVAKITKTIQYSLYGHGDTGSTTVTTITKSYADMQFSSARALVKFDVSDINREYVSKATLTYKMKEQNLQTWWIYNETTDYSAIIDGISSAWDIGSDRSDTINKQGFTESENIATSSKTQNTREMAADITTDFKTRTLTDGNISYMIRTGGKNYAVVVDTDGDYSLDLEFITETDLLEKINQATTAEEIGKILTSGMFKGEATYKKYAELNNKTGINTALIPTGGGYASLDAFNTAFESAYAEYIKNPESEDVPGKTYQIAASMNGGMDSGKKIQDTFNVIGGQYSIIYYVKTDISKINPDFVRSVKLILTSAAKEGTYYEYSEDKTYAAKVSRTKSDWNYGDGYQVTTANDFVQKDSVATLSNAGNKILEADVTEDVVSQLKAGESLVSYRLEATTEDALYLDKSAFMGLEVEYINDYELLQLINKAATAEKIGEILGSGLFADNETYKKYAKLNNKTRINTALIPASDGYASLDAFNTAFESAYKSYMQTPDEEDKTGKTATIGISQYGRGEKNGSNNQTTIDEEDTYIHYGSMRVLMKFNVNGINRDYIKKATLTYNLMEKYSNWYTYSADNDYSATIDGVSSNWNIGDSRDNNIQKADFTENANVAKSYKMTEKTTYAVMAADITEDFKTRTLTDNNISYMINGLGTQDKYNCVLNKDCGYTIVLEYINGYELLQKYNTVKNDSTALSAFINEVAKIEGKTKDIEPEIAAMVIGGKEFSSYDALLTAIIEASEGGMAVTGETVSTATEGKITGTFSICNFNLGDATDTVYAIVAGYNSTSNEMLASYIVKNEDSEYTIEVDQSAEGDDGSLEIGKAADLSFELTDADSKIDLIKVYLWKNFTTMSPYAEAKELRIEN